MMTTTAALLGALPLCFSFGEGGELRQPLGISIVGGLIMSQVADALHDAGRLSLSRPDAAVLFAAAALAPIPGKSVRFSDEKMRKKNGAAPSPRLEKALAIFHP